MCSSDPFFLDNWDLETALLPLKGYQVPRTLPYFEISSGLISDLEGIYIGNRRCMLRIKLDGELLVQFQLLSFIDNALT